MNASPQDPTVVRVSRFGIFRMDRLNLFYFRSSTELKLFIYHFSCFASYEVVHKVYKEVKSASNIDLCQLIRAGLNSKLIWRTYFCFGGLKAIFTLTFQYCQHFVIAKINNFCLPFIQAKFCYQLEHIKL